MNAHFDKCLEGGLGFQQQDLILFVFSVLVKKNDPFIGHSWKNLIQETIFG